MAIKIDNLIGIDASRSSMKQKTGTEYYSYELIRNLVLLKDHKFVLYAKEPITYIEKKENVEIKVMKFPRLWSQIRLSWEMMNNAPTVLFEPAHTIPVIHPMNTVVTLHDVGFKYFPELYTPLERYYHDFSMRHSVKHAKKIIAISNATKNDLIKIYGADEKKIKVIYHGFDKQKYYQRPKSEDVAQDILKFAPYIFFIGRLEAKKNIKNMVRAFSILKKDKSIKHKLVLAGRPGYLYEEIKDEIDKLSPDVKKDVIELGYVEDERVGQLMRNASIFFFPSYFEGFGMPLVEAMACGVPIVASNTTSIPEILNGSGILCDPERVEQFAKEISKIIKDDTLRQGLIAKGLERSKNFDWTKCARETLELIDSTISSV